MNKGDILQWSAQGALTDSKLLDTILKDGNTAYLVEDKGTGYIHTIAPELVQVINP